MTGHRFPLGSYMAAMPRFRVIRPVRLVKGVHSADPVADARAAFSEDTGADVDERTGGRGVLDDEAMGSGSA